MFLIMGYALLAAGLIFVLNISLFNYVNKFIAYIIVLLLSVGFLVLGGLHGWTMSCLVLILGVTWIKYFKYRKSDARRSAN